MSDLIKEKEVGHEHQNADCEERGGSESVNEIELRLLFWRLAQFDAEVEYVASCGNDEPSGEVFAVLQPLCQ